MSYAVNFSTKQFAIHRHPRMGSFLLLLVPMRKLLCSIKQLKISSSVTFYMRLNILDETHSGLIISKKRLIENKAYKNSVLGNKSDYWFQQFQPIQN